MRWHLASYGLVLIALALTAHAQDPLITDPAGDLAFSAAGQAQSPPSESKDSADLVALLVEESPATMTFHVDVVSLQESGDPYTSDTEYGIVFDHHDQRYQVGVRRGLSLTQPSYFAWLETYDEGRDTFSRIGTLDVTAGDTRITIEVPRDMLPDRNGATPFPGRTLSNFTVGAVGLGYVNLNDVQGQDVQTRFWDRMPDDGRAGEVVIQYGIQQTGSARLASEEPFRASNGEATTFVFDVVATNIGLETDTYTLAPVGVPSGWDVSMPNSVLQIEGNSSLHFPVVVRTVFAHEHGAAKTFVLEMTSNRDPNSVGRIEMGVRYPAIPQPAGHHDTVYLHSRDLQTTAAAQAVNLVIGEGLGDGGGGQHPYMNTYDQDESDDDVAAEANYCGLVLLDDNATAGSRFCWTIALEPSLEMGLDFDLSRQGTIEATVSGVVPLPKAHLGGILAVNRPLNEPDPDDPFSRVEYERIELAEIHHTNMIDIGATGQALLEGDVVPFPEADLITYRRGSYLELELHVITDRPDNFYLGAKQEPMLEPGGAMTLPLLEYEDPVTAFFTGGQGILLEPLTPQSKAVNPGDTVLFRAKAANTGELEETFTIRLIGSNRDWAELLTPSSVRIAAGGEAEIALSIRAPSDAEQGQRADLSLEVASDQSLENVALMRFVATVDEQVDHPDESGTAEALRDSGAKDSPFVAIGMVLLGLALVAWRRR